MVTVRPATPVRRALASAAVALALVLPGAAAAAAEDAARGRELFQLCAACHGAAGEGSRLHRAPVIAGLPRAYVEAQLVKFKEGVRGFAPADAEGLRMRPMARALGRPGDVAAVSAWVAGLLPPAPPRTAAGDAARGKAAYAACVACHGQRAGGNEALGAPPLARQADWYLAAQLDKFRRGLRGTHPGDVGGAQMRPIALALPDERAIADLVTYIGALAADRSVAAAPGGSR